MGIEGREFGGKVIIRAPNIVLKGSVFPIVDDAGDDSGVEGEQGPQGGPVSARKVTGEACQVGVAADPGTPRGTGRGVEVVDQFKVETGVDSSRSRTPRPLVFFSLEHHVPRDKALGPMNNVLA